MARTRRTVATDAHPAPTRAGARDRITIAALDLFERDGYAATTIESITTRAGVARRTFFHHFRSKDDVVFPGHDNLITRVTAHLREREKDPPVDTISDALRIVFATYLQDPVLALRRYRLTQRTPELREREIAWVHSYQLLFSRYLDERYREQPQGALAAEAVAASLVSVHNHVLRNWLKRGGGGDPAADLDHALGWLSRSFGLVQRGGNPRRVLVAVLDEDYDPQELTRRIDELRT